MHQWDVNPLMGPVTTILLPLQGVGREEQVPLANVVLALGRATPMNVALLLDTGMFSLRLKRCP